MGSVQLFCQITSVFLVLVSPGRAQPTTALDDTCSEADPAVAARCSCTTQRLLHNIESQLIRASGERAVGKEVTQETMNQVQSSLRNLQATGSSLQRTTDELVSRNNSASESLQNATKSVQLAENLQIIHTDIETLGSQIQQIVHEEIQSLVRRHHDCAEIKKFEPDSQSGVYRVFPNGNTPTDVYCDMQTEGGGWLVFQKRYGGYVDFFRGWEDYAAGFGSLEGEFWLGNRKLSTLCMEKTYDVRIVMSDFDANTKYAQYAAFNVTSEEDCFRLSIGSYTGDADCAPPILISVAVSDESRSGITKTTPFVPGDGNLVEFELLPDRDHDAATSNCAEQYKGAWWYEACHASNLNGLYLGGSHESYADGMEWHAWKGHHYSMKTTLMMFRPDNF